MGKASNHRLLNALLRKPCDKTPIWLMRQAGRYLPEYRRLREKAGDFMTLCKTSELACEVTLQPLARFDLDAAIIFADILTIPDAMGLGLYFVEGEGPKFKNPIRDESHIKRLGLPDVTTDLGYVLETVRLVKHELANRIPVLGFSGSPWTLATYMVEGGANKNFPLIKNLMRENPQALHQLLETLTLAVIDYLNAQIEAGASGVMLFDTWGGMLTTEEFHRYSYPYLQRIVASLVKEYDGNVIPSILFTKNGGQWLTSLADSGCNAISLDATTDIGLARALVGQRVALQGNFEPTKLFQQPEEIVTEVKSILAKFGHGSGHVFNLGHGILPQTPVEHVQLLVDSVHELSIPYHQGSEN